MSPLPLLKHVAEDGVTFVMTSRAGCARPISRVELRIASIAPDCNDAGRALALDARMPSRAPGPGEQYRFHVDMGRCIGCKCCVVACNEQNGNPAAINWRRVGEIEGGWYPNAHAGLSLDGLQSLCQPDLSQRLSGRRLHQGPGHGHRAPQRRRVHRVPGTARGIARTASRSTTLNAASSANATCVTDASSTARRRPA